MAGRHCTTQLLGLDFAVDDRLANRFWSKVSKTDVCWLWTGCGVASGHGTFTLNLDGRRCTMVLAHRVSWVIHFGAIPAGMCVCHTCDVPGCVRPDHLFLGTRQDNVRDRHAKGRTVGPGLPKVRVIQRPRQRNGLVERFWSKVEKGDSCWLWTGALNLKGYGVLGLPGADTGNITAHRASWSIHCGAIPDGAWVLHRCDNPACVNPEHLFLGNAADNVHDMDAKGRRVTRSAVGEDHCCARITEGAVREIRQRMRAGERCCDLAEEFGVSRSALFNAATGNSWRCVDEPVYAPRRMSGRAVAPPHATEPKADGDQGVGR